MKFTSNNLDDKIKLLENKPTKILIEGAINE